MFFAAGWIIQCEMKHTYFYCRQWL